MLVSSVSEQILFVIYFLSSLLLNSGVHNTNKNVGWKPNIFVNFRTLRQPLLGEWAKSSEREKERKKEKKRTPWIVVTFVLPAAQWQRTQSGRTNISFLLERIMLNGLKAICPFGSFYRSLTFLVRGYFHWICLQMCLNSYIYYWTYQQIKHLDLLYYLPGFHWSSKRR